MDYDHRLHSIVNSAFSVDYSSKKYYHLSGGNNELRANPLVTNQLLTSYANQFRMRAAFGNTNKRGWNASMWMRSTIIASRSFCGLLPRSGSLQHGLLWAQRAIPEGLPRGSARRKFVRCVVFDRQYGGVWHAEEARSSVLRMETGVRRKKRGTKDTMAPSWVSRGLHCESVAVGGGFTAQDALCVGLRLAI